jgi:hypothetical protein
MTRVRPGLASRFAPIALLAFAGAIARASAGCAADPGDPLKSSLSGSTLNGEDSGAPEDEGNDGSSSQAGGSSSSGGAPSGSSGGAVTTNEEASTSAMESGSGGTPDATGGAPPARDASVDGPACLESIPSSCPDCATQNASDKPVCERYIACFIANDCDPNDPCGENDGVCGVNTIGGGDAPLTAAVLTYNCACN